jgi:hypothetical protein
VFRLRAVQNNSALCYIARSFRKIIICDSALWNSVRIQAKNILVDSALYYIAPRVTSPRYATLCWVATPSYVTYRRVVTPRHAAQHAFTYIYKFLCEFATICKMLISDPRGIDWSKKPMIENLVRLSLFKQCYEAASYKELISKFVLRFLLQQENVRDPCCFGYTTLVLILWKNKNKLYWI